jgi:hypothetical protein
VAATNEPRRIECGAPDYQVARGALPVGHVEAKDLHVDLDKEQRSAQMARYLKALPNLILTNYLEFRWFVNGELRESARLARRDRGGKVVREPQGEMDVRRLLAGFLAQQPPVVGRPRELALRLAELARLTRGLIVETFKREGARGELALANLRTCFVGGGANMVDKISYDAANGRVHISATHYFEGVDPNHGPSAWVATRCSTSG